jgi:hypothetical protein
MKTCLVGVATLMAVAACSSTARIQTAGSTAVAQIGAECTADDLARVTVLPAPKGRVVTETIELGGGRFLDPPPAGVTPKLMQDEALAAMHQASTPSAAGADLWLGVYGPGPSPPPGAAAPVLAWVEIVHHVAVLSAFPHPAPEPGMTDPPPPPCFWAEETSVVNADTGEQLGFSISSTDPAVFGSSTAPPVQQTIAWLDEPGVPNQRLAWAHTLSTTIMSAPRCALSALHLEADLNAGMSQVYGRLWVHNVSSSECEVQGLPDVDLINDAGAVVAHTDPALAQADGRAPIVLAPDSWAQAILGLVAVSTPGVCGASPAFTELAIRWNGDVATIAYSGGGRISPECPQPTVPSSPTPWFGMTAFAVIPDPGQYMFAGVTARIEAPASVRAGETLRYSVLLVNNSGSDVIALSGSDCPIYRESVGDASGQYVLNCGAVTSSYSAGHAIRFEMELEVPASTPAGPTSLVWRTTEPTGLSATAAINVVDA